MPTVVDSGSNIGVYAGISVAVLVLVAILTTAAIIVIIAIKKGQG